MVQETERSVARTPSRRAVIRAGAWSVPVIAVAQAAPAFAASPCTTQTTVSWNSFTAGTVVTSVPTAGGVTMNIASTPTGTVTGNDQVFATTTSASELRFFDSNNSGSTNTITITWTKPVSNLKFTIVDIDRTTTWDDRVWLTNGFTSSFAATTNLVGSGTSATDPFRSTSTTSAADGSTLGTVTITYAGQISRVDITYFQPAMTVSGSPHVGLGNMTWFPVVC